MVKRVHIWCPDEPSMHGKVIDWPDHNMQVVIPKPPKFSWDLGSDLTDGVMHVITETLEIKQWRVGNNTYWIALQWDHSLPPAVVHPEAPDVWQIFEKWPEIKMAASELMNCPKCNTQTRGYLNLAYMTMQCFECKCWFSEQFLHEYQRNPPKPPVDTYREKAASEFEGVEAPDETIWGTNEEGLL